MNRLRFESPRSTLRSFLFRQNVWDDRARAEHSIAIATHLNINIYLIYVQTEYRCENSAVCFFFFFTEMRRKFIWNVNFVGGWKNDGPLETFDCFLSLSLSLFSCNFIRFIGCCCCFLFWFWFAHHWLHCAVSKCPFGNGKNWKLTRK